MVSLPTKPRHKFPSGRVMSTPGAMDALEKSGQPVAIFLLRHLSGDWGDVCSEDGKLNDAAIRDGERVLSAYELSTGVRIWIITERDRSYTTLTLPEEY